MSTTASSRLRQDYIRIMKDPVPYIQAVPLPSNILEWHYIVTGPAESPYEGGYYHGKLVFPAQYPFKPPSIYMITPNGRFKVNTKLCLSISDFHPDTWNPAWSVSTILTGLLSFMLESAPTLGSIESSYTTKRQLAHQSLSFNVKNRIVKEQFPDLFTEMNNKLSQREEELERCNKSVGILPGQSAQGNANDENVNGGLGGGALINIGVIVGFAAFAFVVKYVWKTLAEES